MSSPVMICKDINGTPVWVLQQSSVKFSVNLAMGVDQFITVPSTNKHWVAFYFIDPGKRILSSINSVTVAPGSSFSNTNSSLNRSGDMVKSGDIIHFQTIDTNALLVVELFSDPQFGVI